MKFQSGMMPQTSPPHAEDDTVYISYQQLYDEVRVYVKAMRNEGIKKGDHIACYMSNKKEAVFAFLATAAIGAVWCGCLPLLGSKRLYIFCSVFISEFLKEAREEIRNDPQDIEFEQLPFDHPLCISFTSGTTGAPKGLVHSAGNGWISWNMNVNALHLGLSVVMYDGDPFQESPTRFWDLIDKFGLTSMYLWSSTIDDMDINGWLPTPKHSLKSLRQILPNGSPAKPNAFDFLSEKVKPGLFCSSAYGTTEVFGLLSGVDHNLPVYRGEIQLQSLGMDVRVLDEKGNPVIGQRGTCVLANPYPALPVCLLNDENKEKVTEMYLADYPVEGFPGVKDSVVTSQYNKNMDERVILFVRMFPGHELTDKVKEKINKTIEHHLTYEHIPNIIMEAPDIPVIDLSIPMDDLPEWFEGAKLNFAENLLRNKDDRTALIMTGEDRETKRVSYAEMYETVKLYAAAFRKFGIKKGDIISKLPNLEKLIIVPSKKESKLKDISGIQNSCFLDEFLQLGYEKDGSIPPIVFEQVSFSHPVFISYTSGTTGLPKVLVHGCGGLLAMAKDYLLNIGQGKKFNFLSMSPVNIVTIMFSE
ncbi:unnamed protein product [Larinioides sclopetarius]|uniref:AMP-dependent synthetase/ligase domain-containing protein n=1 Tax=Larinioides sclopetarius TaxID=280406 RepID=A0AAV2BHS3_9ARAC